MKTISEVLRFFSMESSLEDVLLEVEDDSRRVKPHTLFIAIGKGNAYKNEAKKRGAILILSDEEIPQLKEQLLSFLLWFYDHPEKYFSLIGVTGTNGKSSTAYFLHHFLKDSYLISTLKVDKNTFLSKNTTPTPVPLVHAFLEAKRRKKKQVIMEVSSIGIHEKRVQGLLFQHLIFTNLEEDHLDYHGTLEAYQKTKLSFFNDQVAYKWVGEDMESHPLISPYEIVPSLKISKKGKIIGKYKEKNLSFSSLGEFQRKNLAFAFALCTYFEVPFLTFYYKSKTLRPLKGRYEQVLAKPRVIIDYAHTASAFLTILKTVKKETKGKLIVVFGAGGERDIKKRPLYGEYAFRYADIVIVSNDNPRLEDPMRIVHDIIRAHASFFKIELDRKKAIERALSYSEKKDTVLLLGKGHEEVQWIGGKEIYLSEKEIVKEWKKTHKY